MTKLNELKKEWLKKPDVKVEYAAHAEEFSRVEAHIRAHIETDSSIPRTSLT